MDNIIKQIGDKLIKGKWNFLTLIIEIIMSISWIVLSGSLFGLSLGLGGAMGGNGFQSLFNTLGIMFLVLLVICVFCIILVARHNVLAIVTGIFLIIMGISSIFAASAATNSIMNSYGLGAYSSYATNTMSTLLLSSFSSFIYPILLTISGIIGIKYNKMISKTK